MQLREALKGNKIIKLGAINGGSWFFVGSANVLLNKADEYDKIIMEYIYRKHREAIKRRKKDMADFYADYEDKVLPLLDREVRDVFESDPLADHTLNILVDGNEIGGYWISSEAKHPFKLTGIWKKKPYGEV